MDDMTGLMSIPLRRTTKRRLIAVGDCFDLRGKPQWRKAGEGMANNRTEMISFRHGPLRVTTTEVWSPRESVASADIVRYWHPDAAVDERSCTAQYTIEIDLTLTLDSLFAAMGRSTRSQIRHAAREEPSICFLQCPDDEILESFVTFYGRVGWEKLSTSCVARLQALKQKGMLVFSNVGWGFGEPLLWHCYETAGHRARLLYSSSGYRTCQCSGERNKVARANRYLHYQDMAAFQLAGYAVYDFGGWYAGDEDTKLLGINRFKEDFGGRVVKCCFYDVGVTPLGKCWLILRKLRRGW
jgi:hypothetical protein